MVRIRAIIVAFALISVSGAAHAETYVCNIKMQGAKKFPLSEVKVSISRPYREVRVTDDAIRKFKGEWITAEATVNTAQKVSIIWQLVGVRGPRERTSDLANKKYRLTIQKKTGAATIVIANAVARARNSYTGIGSCKTLKD